MALVEIKHAAVSLCRDYFLDRFLSPLKDHGAGDLWIAGGAIRDWWLHRKPQSDIDVWFGGGEAISAAKKAAEALGWALTRETAASVNYRTDKGQWVQFVQKHFFPNLEETLAQFDFTVCCGGVGLDGRVLVHEDFFVDLSMRRLAFNAIPFPTSSFKRSAKYAEKGFKFCPDEQRKLLSALQSELAGATLEQAEARYME